MNLVKLREKRDGLDSKRTIGFLIKKINSRLNEKSARKKFFMIILINIIVMIFLAGNIKLTDLSGRNFVAGTLDQTCKYDIPFSDSLCQTGHSFEEKTVCCPDFDSSELNEQQFCRDDGGETPDAYCISGDCTCKDSSVNPAPGERFGVGTCVGVGCGGLSSLSCRGLYFSGLCLKGFFYSINEHAAVPTHRNVFVDEKRDWFLTEKGERIPAKIIVTIW